MNTPLVSICCITYNHAPFIRKCLDGFLMQETTFPIEIIIHDDASTDGTDAVVREYEARYPDLIFPMYEKENQFSKIGPGKMDLFNYSRARGKYIAYCEGDDFWTDPLKLQKQVDFMEAHPDCSVTFHDFDTWYYDKDYWQKNDCKAGFEDGAFALKLTLSLFFAHWITQPCTMVFQSCFLPNGRDLPYRYYRDQHEIFHLLKAGDGFIMNFDGAVRCKHSGGIHSGLNSREKESALAVSIAKELYQYNKDDSVKEFLINNLDWAIGIRGASGHNRAEMLRYVVLRFKVSGSFRFLAKQAKKLLLS